MIFGKFHITAAAIGVLLAGCAASYTTPSVSGLQSTGPFPGPRDVCETVVPNAATLRLTTERHNLIACPTHERGAILDRRRDGFNVVGPVGTWTLLQKNPVSTGPLVSPESNGGDHLIGKTVVFFDKSHGTQVAFFETAGREHLWYPGNQRALLGFWRTTPDNRICFRYPGSSINPVTGVSGPEWECGSLRNHSARIVEISDGDVFNLSSGRIPFVMEPRKRYRLAQLQSH